jgi:hypothetical protein
MPPEWASCLLLIIDKMFCHFFLFLCVFIMNISIQIITLFEQLTTKFISEIEKRKDRVKIIIRLLIVSKIKYDKQIWINFSKIFDSYSVILLYWILWKLFFSLNKIIINMLIYQIDCVWRWIYWITISQFVRLVDRLTPHVFQYALFSSLSHLCVQSTFHLLYVGGRWDR